MKVARYWTRADAEATGSGGAVRARARGWSDESLAEARARAFEIAARVAARLASGAAGAARYPYGDRPLPEPVLREFDGAIVTRNSYGALVLNASQMMFVDIDGHTAAPAPGLGRILGSLFGKSSAPPADPVAARLEPIVREHGLAVRLYRTAAGHRLLITNRTFTAGSAEAEALLQRFGSDPLYVRLCRMQESFRARLTPKPYRCRLPNPPVEFPFETPRDQAQFDQWEQRYAVTCARFATCRFLAELGAGGVEAPFRPLIEFHDQQAKAISGLPLA